MHSDFRKRRFLEPPSDDFPNAFAVLRRYSTLKKRLLSMVMEPYGPTAKAPFSFRPMKRIRHGWHRYSKRPRTSSGSQTAPYIGISMLRDGSRSRIPPTRRLKGDTKCLNGKMESSQVIVTMGDEPTSAVLYVGKRAEAIELDLFCGVRRYVVPAC